MRTDAVIEGQAAGLPYAPTRSSPVPLTQAGWGRRAGVLVVATAVAGALVSTVASGGGELVNPGGWSLMRRFWAAAATPELSPAFLAVAVRATLTTLGYAVLGTVGSIVIGLAGAVALSESWWRREEAGANRVNGRGRRLRWGWHLNRGAWAVPRGIHEAVWGLVFISVLGRDPLVAVLAIAIPFGAITAKVFAELIDEQHAEPYETLRAAGAGRVAALAYGVAPSVARDLVSYSFYRFECSIRSSVVLGILGAGGLGFELALSFQSLQYEQMWTLVYCLVLLSALGDGWSAMLRRDPGVRRVRWSLAAVAVMVALFVLRLGIDPGTLWSSRTRDLAGVMAERAWPPRLPPGGLWQLVVDSVETLQMSIAASVIATLLAILFAFLGARSHDGVVHRVVGWVARAVLLFCRAVPAPVWALVLLFVLFPGGLPGAAALGLYNFGILGRLLAEVVENHDPRPAQALRSLGAAPATEFTYGVVPQVAPKFAAYSLYRWEVTMRETVIVGLVGAGGLGRLLAQQNAGFDHGGMLVTVAALIVLTLLVDHVSARIRAALR